MRGSEKGKRQRIKRDRRIGRKLLVGERTDEDEEVRGRKKEEETVVGRMEERGSVRKGSHLRTG